MPIEAHASTQKLIADIEKKDRRFRFAQVLFMVLIIAGLVGTGAFLYISITRSQRGTEATINKQTEYIRCIAKVFAEANQSVTITDLDKCKTEKKPVAESQPTTPPAISVDSTPPSFTPLFVSNRPTPAMAMQPAGSNSGNSQTPPPADQNQHQPVNVLGIPACVQLLDICVSK